MRFDDLDAQMRVFETAHDHEILPGMFIVARLDGRSFTKLTKEALAFERPFDLRFNQMMCGVVQHLMTNTGFKFVYGYTESDEISLLFAAQNAAFNNKMRKLNSVLAGEASAAFTRDLVSRYGDDVGQAVFDCRISQLPRPQQVVDYFRWRQADSERNCLSSWAYWTLRDKDGASKHQATSALQGLGTADKHNLLHERGINFNDLPAWQKRGVGFYTEKYDKTGVNPKTNLQVVVERTRLAEDRELPYGDDYSEFIRGHLADVVFEDLRGFVEFEEYEEPERSAPAPLRGPLLEVYSKAARRQPGEGISLTDKEVQAVIAALNGDPE